MVQVIQWCLEMGIQNISVYAFSIDNYQRASDEVNSLMLLAEQKFQELMQVVTSHKPCLTEAPPRHDRSKACPFVHLRLRACKLGTTNNDIMIVMCRTSPSEDGQQS